MTKRGVIHMVLSILLIGYIGFALWATWRMEANDRYKGLTIVIDQSGTKDFVKAADIDAELGGLSSGITALPRDSVSTLQIEGILRSMDNIERANCAVLSNGMVRLDVVPLIPVARVFDLNGTSYYINHSGKTMQASPRYHIDVPVVTGRFNSRLQPTIVIPVLDYLASSPDMSHLVSQLRVGHNGDIYLVPMIRGHVVNLGDTSDLQNKFERLRVFYRDVMPVKGWEFYDTLSVKWRGQVVANKRRNIRHNEFEILDEDLVDDTGTMTDQP